MLRGIEAPLLVASAPGWLSAAIVVVAIALAVATVALMLARPGIGALAVMGWIGAWGLVTGLALVVLGFRVRRFGRGSGGAGWRAGQPQPAR